MRKFYFSPNKNNITFIFVCIFIINILMFVSRFYITKSSIGGDSVHYYIILRSIFIDKDIHFENEYIYYNNKISPFTKNNKISAMPNKNPVTHRLINKYSVGTAIALIPFFSFAHIISIFLSKTHLTHILFDGYNPIYEFFTGLGGMIYGFTGLIIIYLFGKKLFDSKISIIGTLLVWSSTPIIYYMTMEPVMSHSVSFFSISLFIYYWYIIRDNSKIYQWIFLGFIIGFSTIIRYQNFIFILIPILDIFVSNNKSTKYFLTLFIFFISTFIIIFIQLYENKILYSSFLTTGYSNKGFPFWKNPKLFFTLFSKECGLILWSPALIFCFCGLYSLKNYFPKLFWLFLISFLLQWYLVSSWLIVSQGDSFGNRMLLNCSIIYAVGFMSYLNSILKNRILYIFSTCLFIFLAGLNLLLIALYCFRVIGNPY